MQGRTVARVPQIVLLVLLARCSNVLSAALNQKNMFPAWVESQFSQIRSLASAAVLEPRRKMPLPDGYTSEPFRAVILSNGCSHPNLSGR